MARRPGTGGPSGLRPPSDTGIAAAHDGTQNLSFIAAAKEGDVRGVVEAVKSGLVDINFADPETGFTALHYAAAYNAVPLLRFLVRSARCDFTLADRKGRTAASLAYEVAENSVTGRFLLRKEMQQRRAQQQA
ncbi:ankyrin repeat domain-containing protein [Sinorhizobium medicae]|uniref:ankyrin repeat domain-containing protein n=1 Tax=Sinorhizobium medicae TaxID=110321 RepID=UPI002B1BE17A|nr:ankyrin repeat domain-containing protein [Sinorhizobium medicae]WQO45896.1 ankyrin repeat domain-containing protein [Sinorhizobium medicae]